MVGATLADGWGNVGGWLGQHCLMVGATLADCWGNVDAGWGNIG